MGRGKESARGRGNSYRGGNFRGRGRGRGNHRGRGGWSGSGRGQGHPSSSFYQDEQDFTLQMYADAARYPSIQTIGPGGVWRNQSPFGRGRGRGGSGTPGSQFSPVNSGKNSPNRGRGRGFDSPRRPPVEGIGASKRGRGGPIRPNNTLSNLLYQERPLLRPVVFVPSVYNAVLFQNEEELLQPIVEELDDTERSHVPTADRVSRVFSGGNFPPIGLGDTEDDTEEGEEEIEVVDFKDLDKLLDVGGSTSRKTATIRKSKLSESMTIAEEQSTGFYTSPGPEDLPMDVENLTKIIDKTLSPITYARDISRQDWAPDDAGEPDILQPENLFYVDTQPHPIPLVRSSNQPPSPSSDDDDDIIVYVAPHPRNYSISSKGSHDHATETVPHTTSAVASGEAPEISRFSPYSRSALLPDVTPSTHLEPSVSIPIDERPRSTAEASTPANKTETIIPTIPDPPSFSSVVFSFAGTTPAPDSATTARLRVPPITTARQAKLWRYKLNRAKKREKGKSKKIPSFSALGAMREETLLHDLDHKRDERYDDRRRGDSDLEWGDTDDSGDGEEHIDRQEDEREVDSDLKGVFGMLDKGKGKAKENARQDDEDDHGMEVDPEWDIKAMKSFVGGVLGPNGGVHVTMDDIQDKEIMRIEDDEDLVNQRGSSGSEDEDEDEDEDDEVDEAIRAEEAKLMVEGDREGDNHGPESPEEDDNDVESDEDCDDDEYDYEENSFQARLERIRGKAKERSIEIADDGDDGNKDNWFEEYMTWANNDEGFLQHLNDMLDENEDILTAKDRKQRNKLFSELTYDYDDMKWVPARRNKDKYKDLPLDLQEQWKKDRLKKAEYKKARELGRLVQAADPRLLVRKKGRKKGRKAILTATGFLDPTIEVIPNGVIDVTTLVQQIRRFIADVGGPKSMALPPTNKETRKNIHEIAMAFQLKSQSKGKHDARYTTLFKTTKTGTRMDEAKVARIVRRSGGTGARGDSFYSGGKERPVAKLPRQREGDIVGKSAPKLDDSNVGFRLLALMGWSEGERIGGSMKGLEVPLTAVIKNSRLGLGAYKKGET